MKLNENNKIYVEKTGKGCYITIDYTRYWETKEYKGYMLEMYMLLTNWKSNEGYGVVDFETYAGTNKMTIYFDCTIEEALQMIGGFSYYDWANKYSDENNKEFKLLDIRSKQVVDYIELYNDNKEFEEVAIRVKQL